MGNKPSNTTGGGGVAVEGKKTLKPPKSKSTLSRGTVGGVAPVVPLGPKNYVDMGFPEEDPTTGEAVLVSLEEKVWRGVV